jgi:4-amino-4-deoxy-L-arabinose transferase-like glycosyltransferase
MPHGNTDGFAIWNSHARYLYRDPRSWQQHIHNTYHPDYPLLVPSLVTRVWRYSGVDVPDLGGLTGLVFPFLAVAVLGTALAWLRGTAAGILLSLTLLTTSYYMVMGTYQEADIPLSAFILCTVALVYLYFGQESHPKGLLILAGFLAGSAAWTKNEGILFLLAASFTLAFPVLWKPRATLPRVALFFLGASLPVAVLLHFKMTVNSQTDLFQERHLTEIVAKVTDLDRYAITSGSFLSTAWDFGRWTVHPFVPLLGFLIWRGFNRSEIGTFQWRTVAGILLIVLAGYYWIFVITPAELTAHLESALPRLLMHVWPSVILLIGLAAKRESPSSL